MKLKALVIKDFKGIENLTIFPDGKNLNISGANETGKTSIYDAFRFLIDGKDSLDRKDFGIKPIGVSGVDVEVEAVLDTATLKKVYKEVWTKRKAHQSLSSQGTLQTIGSMVCLRNRRIIRLISSS